MFPIANKHSNDAYSSDLTGDKIDAIPIAVASLELTCLGDKEGTWETEFPQRGPGARALWESGSDVQLVAPGATPDGDRIS